MERFYFMQRGLIHCNEKIYFFLLGIGLKVYETLFLYSRCRKVLKIRQNLFFKFFLCFHLVMLFYLFLMLNIVSML